MTQSQHQPVVLVTGNSGLIGSRICQRLLDRYMLVGLDLNPPEQRQTVQEWIQCDLTKDSSVSSTLQEVLERFGSKIASVIHLAAYYDFSGESSPLYDDLTVEGTRRLLRGLNRFKHVGQFVFSSSLLVMKPCDLGRQLNEDAPTQAEWAYPQSKLDAEQVIQEEHGEIPTVILRLAGAYDELGHSPPITQNIRRIAEKELESYLFPGDADRGQAFIHLDDIASCVDLVVERRKQLDDYLLLLIAEDECLSYEKLQDRIGELIYGEEDWPTIRIPKIVAKAGAWAKEQLASREEEEPFIKPWMVDLADAHYPVDNSRARSILGWTPTRSLSTTLPAMIAGLKQNPRKWYETNHLPLPSQDVLDEISSVSLSKQTENC
ncbi:NAD-dependent epimerase/dehydratase family protein [Bythopirellula goksoeyrii]|uniref:UDP-galactose-4-epimerase n=1 Tax=Bythopirellula goksoeyrii TaxID=1400387 RepID=A0A5B9QDC9_9BACT|nr:NAD(P)-dependent oxidoreductase [Bythopirellula goksoeyrii]QEG36904.1 UDP-galactose-4-epimerase [Bythopirellula goksoeyrii]